MSNKIIRLQELNKYNEKIKEYIKESIDNVPKAVQDGMYISNIVFNTSLSIDEVKSILDKINYLDDTLYAIAVTESVSKMLVIYKDSGEYGIEYVDYTKENEDDIWKPIFYSAGEQPGWFDFDGSIEFNDSSVSILTQDGISIPIGVQNNLLTDILTIQANENVLCRTWDEANNRWQISHIKDGALHNIVHPTIVDIDILPQYTPAGIGPIPVSGTVGTIHFNTEWTAQDIVNLCRNHGVEALYIYHNGIKTTAALFIYRDTMNGTLPDGSAGIYTEVAIEYADLKDNGDINNSIVIASGTTAHGFTWKRDSITLGTASCPASLAEEEGYTQEKMQIAFDEGLCWVDTPEQPIFLDRNVLYRVEENEQHNLYQLVGNEWKQVGGGVDENVVRSIVQDEIEKTSTETDGEYTVGKTADFDDANDSQIPTSKAVADYVAEQVSNIDIPEVDLGDEIYFETNEEGYNAGTGISASGMHSWSDEGEMGIEATAISMRSEIGQSMLTPSGLTLVPNMNGYCEIGADQETGCLHIFNHNSDYHNSIKIGGTLYNFPDEGNIVTENNSFFYELAENKAEKGTEVPNSGKIDYVYLNNALSLKDTTLILRRLMQRLDWNFGTLWINNTPINAAYYAVVTDATRDNFIRIVKYNSVCMITVNRDDGNGDQVLFTSDISDAYDQHVGWKAGYSGVEPITWTLSPFYNDSNSKIISIFSSTPYKKDGSKYLTIENNTKVGSIGYSSGVPGIFTGTGEKKLTIGPNSGPSVSSAQPTPIVNDTYIDKIYFNTSLSVDEVYSILDTLTWFDPQTPKSYQIISSSNPKHNVTIFDCRETEYGGAVIYVYEGPQKGRIIFSTSTYIPYGASSEFTGGWNIDADFYLDIQATTLSSGNDGRPGNPSNISANLVSTTPYEIIPDKTYTFPDKNGTIALLSDIPLPTELYRHDITSTTTDSDGNTYRYRFSFVSIISKPVSTAKNVSAFAGGAFTTTGWDSVAGKPVILRFAGGFGDFYAYDMNGIKIADLTPDRTTTFSDTVTKQQEQNLV